MQRVPVWPMAVGVAASMLALEWMAAGLQRGTLSGWGLLALAVSLMVAAAMVSGLVVRAIYARAWPGMRRVSAPVVRAACLAALWVPAWVLLMETWSGLMVVAGCVCLASLGVFLKRCVAEDAAVAESGLTAAGAMPFLLEFDRFSRVILPSLLLALLAESAAALVIARWFVVASFAGGAFAAVVGWRAVQRFPQDAARPVLPGRSQTAMVGAAFVLTVMALVPYLKVPPFSGGLVPQSRLKGAPKDRGAAKEQSASSEGYVGIILLAPRDERKKIVLPVKRDPASDSVRLAEPMEIPFDGAYWYFKAPDKAPRPTAKVVKGSAAKVSVRSTDKHPLLMEAHQRLNEPIDLGCCSAIDLAVENNDKRPGPIVLELWVRKRGQPATALHYLGTETIPSSEQPYETRAAEAVEESVRFPIPPSMDGIEFDEMTVVMRGAPERAAFGVQVGLRKFVLEP